MKRNETNKKRNGHKTHSIRIEFTHPTASAVAIAGSFNDWHAAATQMVRVANDHWVKDLVLAPGKYEYRLVVDGAWISDPRATEAAQNPFGELNSVLQVKLPGK